MKKIFFASLLLFGLTAVTHAQTPAKTNTKPVSSVTTAPSVTKKPASNTKTSTTTSPAKVSAANIGKHKRKHHKAAKKPAKKS
jgi:hypothetical protein